ncbi:hypothetical protein BT69DRAFT_366336 [Atractiella rhizophila]|nr:hypothetical protein BT69DRAFT_366336 [Atractiella rhizophila]
MITINDEEDVGCMPLVFIIQKSDSATDPIVIESSIPPLARKPAPIKEDSADMSDGDVVTEVKIGGEKKRKLDEGDEGEISSKKRKLGNGKASALPPAGVAVIELD